MGHVNRRNFLKISALASVGAASAGRWLWQTPDAVAFFQSPAGVEKFIQPLRLIGGGNRSIPVALPDANRAPVTGAIHYSLDIGQFSDKLHPSFDRTKLWGYSPKVALGDTPYPTQHLGGIIVAKKGVPIQVTFTNTLPDRHILPVDIGTAMPGGFPDVAGKFGGSGRNAATTHLHGGFVPWISDGGPMTWFTPGYSGGKYGPSIAGGTNNYYKLLNPALKAGQAEYYYPNAQTARMMWYHDHAHDITRLNAYAGMASAYILRDDFEINLKNKGLPEFIENGGREIPIIIQDKIFVGDNIMTADPTWTGPTNRGSLWYPHLYEADRWGSNPPAGAPPIPNPSCIPEMFGDTMLANGTVFPEAKVEARLYRLRILNACQARFLNLQLYVDDGSKDGITLKTTSIGLVPTNAKGPDFLVIGTEGGFLSKPVSVRSNVPYDPVTQEASLLTGPAERWDVLVDFSAFAGKKVILYNDAPAPFPMGDPRNDYFPGAPGNPTQPVPGFGPNTRQIMRFNITGASGKDTLQITTATDLTGGLDTAHVPFRLVPSLPPLPLTVKRIRTLTLNEDFDGYGRLIQLLGTEAAPGGGSSTNFGRGYMDASTENPKSGETEVWQIVNLTGDAHPMHFHLVNVQVLQRQPFDVDGYSGGQPTYTGPAVPPPPTELGWKETVKMYPGTVTTVIMRFDLPPNPPGIRSMPNSLNRNLGVSGKEYVWHCHILEHEEHDMMRPLVVV